MIIDKNSDSSVDLVDWLRRSTDESNNLARNNMLDSARIDDVYKLTGEKKVLDILYDEETGRLTIVYKDGSTVSIYLDPNGGGCDCDLSEYAKLTDLETEVTELESKIPTSTSNLTNDSDFVNSTQVDDRIKEVVGAAPEALDTLHEISKALGDDPDFAATITNQIADVKKSIPSIEGLASETFVKDQINAIPKTDLTGYAKEEWVKSQGYLTEHQDISNLATKAEVEEVKNSIPSIEGLATETYVGQAKSDIEKWVSEQGYLTEHQDISHLATKEDIPSIEGLATEEWVESKNYLTEHQDISNVVKFNKTSDGRKAITLDNHDLILGRTTEGKALPLVMMSKWNVADFGAKGTHANINTVSTTDIATDSEGNNIYTDGLTIYNNKLEQVDHVPVVTVNDDFALATLNHVMAIREADAKTNASIYATKDELNSKIATLNSNFQWKDTVVTYSDIAKVYPDPKEGFSVYVDDERTTYVYMGGEWVAAATADDSEPIATEELDGLMSAEAMRKLNSLENYDDSDLRAYAKSLEDRLSILEAKLAELSR